MAARLGRKWSSEPPCRGKNTRRRGGPDRLHWRGQALAHPSIPSRTREEKDQTARSTSIFFVSAIALAGLRPLGQTFAQFMIVWQR